MDSIIWLAVVIVLLTVEASTVTLVSLWFAAGALAALIAGLFSAPLWLQLTLFLVVSCLSLACLRPVVRKYFKPKLTKTNVDSVIGSEGYVTADVDNRSAVGQVKLGAMEWSARSVNGEIIKAGTLVRVERIEGVKAFVTPVEADVKV